jgi:hypothetical protein
VTHKGWKDVCDRVTEDMRRYTRSFVTPLGTETETDVRLVGTGTYVRLAKHRILLTCQHVVLHQQLHYRYFGSDKVFVCSGPWRADPHPIDAASSVITDTAWCATTHQASEILSSKFARKHSLYQQEELLFFGGFSGENAHYAFGVHQTNGTGYCSQEVQGSGDSQIFELLWNPQETEFTSATTPQIQREIKKENPRGFSGSLVWNTKYLEITNSGGKWSPDNAVVTGLLRRWDEKMTTNLLVWRVEHLNNWLNNAK